MLNVNSPVDFLSHTSWGGVKALANMEQFRNFDKDIEVHECYIKEVAKVILVLCRVQPSAGRSLPTVNAPRKRSSLENGRTRTPSRSSA